MQIFVVVYDEPSAKNRNSTICRQNDKCKIKLRSTEYPGFHKLILLGSQGMDTTEYLQRHSTSVQYNVKYLFQNSCFELGTLTALF